MNIKYLVEIEDPKTHIVNVTLKFEREQEDKTTFFLPSWSPGSYLMREYSRNIRTINVQSQNGEALFFEQISKGAWSIDFNKSELAKPCQEVTIFYKIYCHELTVRTSHVDESHAFLHGPSYLMGLRGKKLSPVVEFRFPALWSKLHTGLKDISEKRDVFLYSAESFDDLLDCPVEIGCHESDGFMVQGKEHHLVWYGEQFPHENNLKADIKKIVETVASHFTDIPYDSYLFITHLKKNLYGGLEHKNSTALHFDGRKFCSREDYVNWLALVAHEYFHTWNVKRIRPIELGPFDYENENYTRMHWLTEGLTSFMDELLVLRSGLCSLEEYLKMQTKNLQRYFSIPGKKFHSLEQASFNAWIKLYRPDENSLNSSISYYLKGGLVFSTLHFELKKVGKSINDLLAQLWQRYKQQPEVGVTTQEVLQMIEQISNSKVRERFELRISTTEDIDFESYYQEIGCEFVWEEQNTPYLGAELNFQGDRAFIKTVTLDGPAFQAGLNAQDEILAIDDVRILQEDIGQLEKILVPGKKYKVTISRLNRLMFLEFICGKQPKSLKSIDVIDAQKVKAALEF